MRREPPVIPLPHHACKNSYNPSPLKEKNCRYAARFDSYKGVLKRVSDMKLSGSLDSEEPGTESESSGSRMMSPSGRRCWGSSSCEDNSGNGSTYEDESSASSFAGSDHYPPYEEIPTEARNRLSCGRLPGTQLLEDKNYANVPQEPSFRESFHDLRRRSSSSNYQQFSTDKSTASCTYSNCDSGCCCEESEVLGQEQRPSPSERVPDGRDTDGITEAEKHQIETFFRGLRTDLHVCSSLANLYVGWKDEEGKWAFRHTGVPLILLDRGDTKSRNKKRIQIMLAERGTCFPLWKDTIDNLTSYRKAGEAFHTMYLSSDHRQIIGLSFDSSSESDLFYDYVNQLTSNPENINISVPGTKKGKKGQTKKQARLPQKDQISNPCLFEHVNSVAAKDRPMYMSLQTLLDKEMMKKRENMC